MLGYTEVSWNDLSGKEQQPWSSIKYWASLTANEKAAAVVLGYTQVSWDNDSGSVPQPASAVKTWALLTACTDGEILLFHILRTPSSFFCLFVFSCEKKVVLAELLLNMERVIFARPILQLFFFTDQKNYYTPEPEPTTAAPLGRYTSATNADIHIHLLLSQNVNSGS